MNIVLDTNTIISGMFWNGAPRQILDLARSGRFTLFTSPELLAELEDVLGREKFSARLQQAQAGIEELVFGFTSLAITVRPEKIAPVITVELPMIKCWLVPKLQTRKLLYPGTVICLS